jgi:hypothetical protein
MTSPTLHQAGKRSVFSSGSSSRRLSTLFVGSAVALCLAMIPAVSAAASPATDAAATVTKAPISGHQPGQLAPPFTLPDAAGTKRSLADFKGKWVVLEWVNYDCPFVKKHYGSGNMPALQKEMRAQGIVWLSINSSAEGKQGSFRGEALQARMKTEKAEPDHYLIDADGKVGKSYNAKTTPTMVLINPQGAIAYVGAIDDHPSTDAEDIPKSVNYVKQAVSQAFAGKPVETASTKSYGCSVKYAN